MDKNKKKIITPELEEFLQDAFLLEECRTGEVIDMVYSARDGSKLFNFSSWRWLNPYLDTTKGYYKVDLKTPYRKKAVPFEIHRLVARVHCWRSLIYADVRKPWSKLWVHHRNGIKTNNQPENLEIIDPGYHNRIHKGHNEELLVFIPAGMEYGPVIELPNGELCFVPPGQEPICSIK